MNFTAFIFWYFNRVLVLVSKKSRLTSRPRL